MYLIIAGLFEVGFATCLGKIRENSHMAMYLWGVGFFICIGLSMYFLNKALEEIPLGTAYAVWTGIGAVGTVLVGIVFLKDPVSFWRLFFVLTLIGSIIGLKLVSSH